MTCCIRHLCTAVHRQWSKCRKQMEKDGKERAEKAVTTHALHSSLSGLRYIGSHTQKAQLCQTCIEGDYLQKNMVRCHHRGRFIPPVVSAPAGGAAGGLAGAGWHCGASGTCKQRCSRLYWKRPRLARAPDCIDSSPKREAATNFERTMFKIACLVCNRAGF
jgi:hypothetical protein